MPEIIYWLGDAGETFATICIRADTNGTYVVECNGVSGNIVIDTSINYGVGAVTLTGLPSNASLAFTISLSSVVYVNGTLRTMPGANDSFYVMFASCMSMESDMIQSYWAVRNYDVRALFLLGDMPYCDSPIGTGGNSRFGTTNYPGSYADPSTINTWHDQYLYLHRDIPGFRFAAERVPTYRLWDDHEALCNDMDHKLVNINATFTAQGASTFANQAAADAAFNRAREAYDVWSVGNPTNSSPFAVAEKPRNADASTSVNNYPAQYFSKDIGSVKFLGIDTVSHRGGTDDADDGTLIEHTTTAKTLLGRNQMKWLKGELIGSSKAFNSIMSPKATYKGTATSDNHGYNDCVTERDHLVDWIYHFARGVAWDVGDVHTPFVINDEKHALVNSSSVSQCDQDGTSAVNMGTGYTEGFAWKPNRYFSGARGTPRANGLMYITPNYVDRIITDNKGRQLTKWRQYPNQNTMVKIF